MFSKNKSVFQDSFFSGPLSGRGRKIKKGRAAGTLMLTSLIDAFSILVVYLLMFFSDAGEMAYVSSDIDLPRASAIERLDRYSIIQVRKDGYFVEEKQLAKGALAPYLVNLKSRLNRLFSQDGETGQKETVTIQADKTITYKHLSPIIQACGHAGFSHIKFAVLSE